MKTKGSRTKVRVWVNTGLFIVMAILSITMAICGAERLRMYQKNLVGVTDAPALCYDEEAYEKSNHLMILNAYPCKTAVDENGNSIPADSLNEQSIFLYDRIGFSGTILSNELQVVIMVVGSLLSMASLVGGIIYWNHNRNCP